VLTCIENLAELGWAVVDLPAAPDRRARRPTLASRACQVEIPRPQRHLTEEAAKLAKSVALWLVEAYEVDPPPAAETRHWLSLTTHAVGTRADAKQIIGLIASAGLSGRCSG
jgi:hypothetical protein